MEHLAEKQKPHLKTKYKNVFQDHKQNYSCKIVFYVYLRNLCTEDLSTPVSKDAFLKVIWFVWRL